MASDVPDQQASTPGSRPVVTVLVADDDSSIRSGLAKIIDLDDGLDLVAIATDAPEAIALAREHQPAVALLDVNMPGGGGPSASAGIRAGSPQTRIIAHSVHDDRAAVMEMVRAGAVGYIVKGATSDEIRDTLHRAGAGQSTLSGEVVSTVVHELASILHLQEQQADVRRAEIAAARRLVAGQGLELRIDPVLDLQSGAFARAEARPILAPAAGRSLEAALEAADAVGYRVDAELALVAFALREARSLPDDPQVVLPVSPATLTSTGFQELDIPSLGLDVTIELSGSAAAPNYGQLQSVLVGLRNRGVRLAASGLGSTVNGLNHALRLRPDLVKLEPQLASTVDGDPAETTVLKAAQLVAKGIGADLMVCGLASQRQADVSRAAGVRLAQGPHIAAFSARGGPQSPGKSWGTPGWT